MCVVSELRMTVEKTSGTINRAAGRERPHKLFGRLKAEKVGSLPPGLVFFPQRLLASQHLVPLAGSSNCSRHKVKTQEKPKVERVFLALFTLLWRAPDQESNI